MSTLNKYLEKIAKEYSEDRHAANVTAAGIHFLGLGEAAKSVGSHLGTKPVFKAVTKPSGNIDKSTLRKILKANKDLDVTFSRFKATKGSTLHADELKLGPGEGPGFLHKDHAFFNGKGLTRNYIHTAKTKNLDAILHEPGHAKAVKLKKYQMPGSHMVHIHNIGDLAGSLMLSHPTTAQYAWAAPLVTTVPSLISEGHANRYAHQMIKQHGGSKMANKFLRGIATKNMLGYAAPGIANSAVLYGLHRLTKKVDNE